ncbi:hypothetical protein [Halospeciosus flavus]|uniref:DUF997 family protein n=1 Tax=Halospeciosus flavus TaxID=3032283 RepID=A0ABD5Z496_9EURY|nr:hypothetical protein [Halospeciosus flavus]
MRRPNVDDLGRRAATATITDLEEFAVGCGVCWAVVAAVGVLFELLYTAVAGGVVGGSWFGVLVGGPVVLAVACLGLAAVAEVYEAATGRPDTRHEFSFDDPVDVEERRE